MPHPKHTLTDFWKCVDIRSTDECWNWTDGCDKDGYGIFTIQKRQWRAPRLAYTATHGDVSPDLMIRHSCDNRLCVNPSHLLLGTNQENIADRHERGRDASGSSNGLAKLTDSDVRQIRILRAHGLTQERIAAQFGVAFSTVGRILRGKTWRHIK